MEPKDTTLGKTWLLTEKHWKNRVGKYWKAKKVLGIGGQGIVGHWYASFPGEISNTKLNLVLGDNGSKA